LAVVTMLNQKGGVGKSSTCHHLAGALAQAGRRVLLVDNDPQSSLTQGFWGPIATAALDPGVTVAALYRGLEPLPEHVIHPTPVPGVDLIPGSQQATPHNVPDPHAAPWDSQTCLRALLAEVRGGYDLALIDCPPNLHLCSWAALAASDFLIVPLQPEDYGSQGLGPVQDSVAAARAAVNPGLGLLGYLLTMVNARATIHQIFEATLRRQYGADVFETKVPAALDFKEAIAQRKPVSLYKPRGASARVMKALGEEVFRRIDERAEAAGRGAA
jgi:chromosome partitioning protein